MQQIQPLLLLDKLGVISQQLSRVLLFHVYGLTHEAVPPSVIEGNGLVIVVLVLLSDEDVARVRIAPDGASVDSRTHRVGQKIKFVRPY